jgi:hypothetical protein
MSERSQKRIRGKLSYSITTFGEIADQITSLIHYYGSPDCAPRGSGVIEQKGDGTLLYTCEIRLVSKKPLQRKASLGVILKGKPATSVEQGRLYELMERQATRDEDIPF